MGTKMAPAFAGIFMADIEEEFLEQERIQPLAWWRYIDDILCIWPSDRESLDHFLHRLNDFHHTLSFTHTTSETSVSFLDLTLYKGQRFSQTGVLDLKPYSKSTNSHQYLHKSSAHPFAVFKGIVKGEQVRLLRASSDENAYKEARTQIQHHLRNRGYSRKLLDGVSVPFSDREEYLQEKQDTEPPPPILLAKYHKGTSSKDLHSALTPSSHSVDKPMLTFTKSKNLSAYLVRAKLPGSVTPKASDQQVKLFHRPSMIEYSAPCGQALCRCCDLMSKKESVFDEKGKLHKIERGTNCSTNCVIYLLECRRCPTARYVGQTARSLRTRMGGHRAASLYKQLPLYTHLRKNFHSFSDLQVTVLEKTTVDQLLNRELNWMTTLGTILPKGLNSKFS